MIYTGFLICSNSCRFTARKHCRSDLRALPRVCPARSHTAPEPVGDLERKPAGALVLRSLDAVGRVGTAGHQDGPSRSRATQKGRSHTELTPQ